MMTTQDVAKPKWALCVWKDTNGNLFAQFEGGYVHKFVQTEGGLSKLLRLIPFVESQPGFLSGGQNIADKIIRQRKIKVARKEREKRAVQPLDRATEERMRSIAKRLEEKK
jgi:hypothetical protein